MAFYTDSQKKIQEKFQSRALADRVEAQIVDDELEDALLSRRPFTHWILQATDPA